MATNLNIDDKLISEAKRLGRHRTKKDAVNAALSEYVRVKELDDLFALFGTMPEFDDFNAAAARGKKRENSDRHVGLVARPEAASPRRNGGARRRAA